MCDWIWIVKKIYYEKVGRRYVPVLEYDSELMSSFNKGAHLIISRPGGNSTRYNINPNYAAMIAAGYVAKEAIIKAIFEASEAKPKSQPLTERQRAAWKEMKAAFGDEMFSLEFDSIAQLVDKGIIAMQEEADKLMHYPAVKAAFDHFQTVCELCVKEETK